MSDSAFLPYGRHAVDEQDIAAVVEVMRSGYLTTGPAVTRFEAALGEIVGVPHVVACNSGTAALHLALAAAGIGAGDIVIVPAMTFVASANAARYLGAEVCFADVEPESGLMEAAQLEAALGRAGDRARMVVPVHLNGQPADLGPLTALARKHGLGIVCDCSHALGTTTGARPAHHVGDGEYEDAGTFSFHPVKTATMGEGGAVTTRSAAVAERARRLRSHGIVREPTAFIAGEQAFDEHGRANPWYYEMQELGYNYRASDLACALGFIQLGKLAEFAVRRRALAAHYDQLLAGLGWPVQPVRRTPRTATVWHLYAVLIDFPALGWTRAGLMRALEQRGIGTQVHYIPVYRQPYYRDAVPAAGLPGAEAYYARVLSLPLFPGMTDGDVERVVSELDDIVQRPAR